MPHARLYIRRSDDDQSEYSPEAQERQGRLWCELHGHSVVGVYIDDDLSGRRDDRPQFGLLVADACRDPGSFVVVHKIDRLARDAETTLRTVKRLDTANVTLISVAENMDFSTPFGRMMLTNLAGWAEFYSRNLGTETKKGLREKAHQGDWVGPVPLGYARHGKTLAPSPDAEAVRLSYDRYESGNESDASVADALNAAGWRALDWHTGKRRLFGRESVRVILTNPAYKGIVRCSGEEQ